MFGISAIYWVLINSFVSFIYLFIISKLLGKKQIAKLEFIDYAVGISLGSIAAEWSTVTDEPFYYYIIAMSIYFVLAFLVAVIGRKATFLKHLLKGRPTTLVYNGKILYKNVKKCKIDVNDLLSMLREKSFFDISDVAYAIFETSGELSVLPKGNLKPVVLENLTQKPKIEEASLSNVMIVDGVISKSGLNEINKDKAWLYKNLKIHSKKELKNILLAIYDEKEDAFDVHYKKD